MDENGRQFVLSDDEDRADETRVLVRVLPCEFVPKAASASSQLRPDLRRLDLQPGLACHYVERYVVGGETTTARSKSEPFGGLEPKAIDSGAVGLMRCSSIIEVSRSIAGTAR